jgi:hypothetical protein
MQEGTKKKHIRFSILFIQNKYFIINRKCDALLIIYSSAAAGASAASTASTGAAAAGAATRTGARP